MLFFTEFGLKVNSQFFVESYEYRRIEVVSVNSFHAEKFSVCLYILEAQETEEQCIIPVAVELPYMFLKVNVYFNYYRRVLFHKSP